MYVHKVSLTSSVSAAAAVAPTYTLSDEIDLNRKWLDNKRMALKVDINGSSASGLLNIFCLISALSGSTYTTFTTASGTTLLLASGTSDSGVYANGSHYIPITIVPASGVTEWLTAGVAPYVKFGTMATYSDVYMDMYLICG